MSRMMYWLLQLLGPHFTKLTARSTSTPSSVNSAIDGSNSTYAVETVFRAGHYFTGPYTPPPCSLHTIDRFANLVDVGLAIGQANLYGAPYAIGKNKCSGV